VPPASTASRPALMTLANAPFVGRDSGHIGLISHSVKQNIFSAGA
jgi:hypothetical protein